MSDSRKRIRRKSPPGATAPRKGRPQTGLEGIASELIAGLAVHGRKLQFEVNRRRRLEHLFRLLSELRHGPESGLNDLMQRLISLLPDCWQYPEATCARIKIDGGEYKTANYGEAQWKTSFAIATRGRQYGAIEVGYLETRPPGAGGPFSRHERNLMQAVASNLAEIMDRRREESELKHRLQLEKVASAISSRFAFTSDFDRSVNISLAEMGRLCKASRSYLFLFREDRAAMDNTHEWCTEGVESQMSGLQNLPCGSFPLTTGKLQGPAVMSTNTLPGEREGRTDETSSVFLLPISVGGRLSGFLGFDNVMEGQQWSADHFATFKMAAEIIGNAIERQRSQQKERQLRQQLEGEINRRNDFTRTLVHELKTPLVPLLASSDVLVDNLKDEPWLSLARNINRGAANLSTLIDELMDAVRGELGTLRISVKPTDAASVLKDAAAYMTPLISSRKQVLTLNLPDSLPRVLADQARLKQVLYNLLTNSSKFTPEGGQLMLAAHAVDGTMTVEVHDSGIGISDEDQKHLFESYYRARTDSGQSGLGLGLALCKRLVELHGGRIWATSKKDKGSVFSFSIPVTK